MDDSDAVPSTSRLALILDFNGSIFLLYPVEALSQLDYSVVSDVSHL